MYALYGKFITACNWSKGIVIEKYGYGYETLDW